MSIQKTFYGFTIRTVLLCGAVVALLFMFAVSSFATSDAKPTAKKSQAIESDTELLVKFKGNSVNRLRSGNPAATGISSVDDVLKSYKVVKFERIGQPSKKAQTSQDLFSWYVVSLPQGNEDVITKGKGKNPKLDGLKQSLENNPDVVAVENNYSISTTLAPNDPYYLTTGTWGQAYDDLWGLKRINVEGAWSQTTGQPSVVVADIDTGIDRNHPDLIDNVWTNAAEIPGNGIDDDANGYVDDYYGWNWVANNNNPMDDNGHGTHTAGTIAAVGNNNIGITGVSWSSKIMGLKFLASSGYGDLANAMKALQYAADMGAKVSSNSWGCSCQSQAVNDAVKYEHDRGMVTVVAAGNDTHDALMNTPAASDGAITVAASDSTNALASFSNFGQRIDVTAPGVDILSLKSSSGSVCSSAVVGGNYCRLSGTSMATPHVAGVAALMLSQNSSLGNEDVRQVLRGSATDIGATGRDSQFGFGLINANNAVAQAQAQPVSAWITSPSSRTSLGATSTVITGTANGSGFASYKVEIANSRAASPVWQLITTSNTPVPNGSLATIDPLQLSDGTYTVRLSVTSTAGKTYIAEVYDLLVDNFSTELISPTSKVSAGRVEVAGTATVNTSTMTGYTLEYGVGTSPTTFVTTNFTLANGGTLPVNSGVLGAWDTSSLVNGQSYTLRLTVRAANGRTEAVTSVVTLDTNLVSGWPKFIPGSSCTQCEATPLIVDLNADGQQELVIGSGQNQIQAYRRDGSNAPGFPVTVTTGDWFKWPLIAADIDGDGSKEIIAGGITSSNQTRIYVIRADGSFYPGWPTPTLADQNSASVSDLTPTIADLNGDGRKELIVHQLLNYQHWLHAYQLDGSELAGFPKLIPVQNSFMQAAPTVADLDNDGLPEIALGDYDKFYLFDNQGNLLPGWPYVAPLYNGDMETFQSTPAVGDLDGDGKLEIIATATPNGALFKQLPLYAWKKDGTILPGWPQATGQYGASMVGWPLNSPSVTDIDGDNKDEVIVGFNNLTIHDIDGPKTLTGFVGNGPTAIGDVAGNGSLKLSGGQRSGSGAVKLANNDGTEYWSTDINNVSFYDPYTITDMNKDGRLEMAAAGSRNDKPGMILYLWQMPGNGSYPVDEWPMFGHDAARTNRYKAGSLVTNDTTAPSVTVTSPTTGSTVSGTTQISASASDNIGVTKVEFYIDNALVSTSQTAPYAYSWDTKQKTNGSHTIYAKAFDAAGNTKSSTIVNVTVSNVDTQSPQVAITAPLNGSSGSKGATINVTATASDNYGVTKVEFYLAGAIKCTDTAGPYSCSMKLPNKAGAVTVQAKAYDAAGLSSTSTITVNVK